MSPSRAAPPEPEDGREPNRHRQFGPKIEPISSAPDDCVRRWSLAATESPRPAPIGKIGSAMFRQWRSRCRRPRPVLGTIARPPGHEAVLPQMRDRRAGPGSGPFHPSTNSPATSDSTLRKLPSGTAHGDGRLRAGTALWPSTRRPADEGRQAPFLNFEPRDARAQPIPIAPMPEGGHFPSRRSFRVPALNFSIFSSIQRGGGGAVRRKTNRSRRMEGERRAKKARNWRAHSARFGMARAGTRRELARFEIGQRESSPRWEEERAHEQIGQGARARRLALRAYTAGPSARSRVASFRQQATVTPFCPTRVDQENKRCGEPAAGRAQTPPDSPNRPLRAAPSPAISPMPNEGKITSDALCPHSAQRIAPTAKRPKATSADASSHAQDRFRQAKGAPDINPPCG